MRNSSGLSAKELTREIARLQEQLAELSAQGGEVIGSTIHTARSVAQDAVKFRDKARDTLIENAESRPLTTMAAMVGIGVLAAWVFRRR